MGLNEYVNSQDYFYENIRNRNVEDYGKKFESWAPKILIDQYSERTHFIYELLQNAEDAKASNVWFRLYYDRLEFEHDGKKEFDEKDIEGICGVGSSNKDSSENIGKFGIGFKSVFAYTSMPKIITRIWSFEIRNLIMPYNIEDRLHIKNTKFVIPFNKEQPSKEESFNEIYNALRNDLMADSILFLENIFNINIEIISDNAYHPTSKKVIDISDNIKMIELCDGGKDSIVSYLLFNKQVKINNETAKTVKIAYKISNNEIVETDYKNIYVYFATSQESHLGFCVHAPFDTTPARDNINSLKTVKGKYNKLLANNIAELVEESIIWLIDNELINLNFCSNILPITPNLHEVLMPTFNRVCQMFKNKGKLIPTNDESYESIDNILIPEAQNIVPIFNDDIMKKINNNQNAKWARMEIALNVNDDFNLYLRKNFGVPRINLEQVSKGLTSNILEEQSDEWLISLFDLIAPNKYSSYRSPIVPDNILKKIPLIRLKNGNHTIKNDDTYLNNGKLKDTIIKNDIGLSFYKNVLNIPYLDERHIFLDHTMKKYKEDNEILYEENIEDLKRIKEFIKDGTIYEDDISEYRFILARDLKNILYWCSPQDVFLTEKYTGSKSLEILMNGIKDEEIYFLSNIYNDYFDKEIFLVLGLKDEIPTSYDGELNTQVFTSRGCYFRTSSTAKNNGFHYKFRMSLLHSIIHKGLDFYKSLEIFKLAKKYEDMIADIVEWNSRQDFSPYANEKGSKTIFSDFGWILNNSPWIYGKDGKVYKPTDIDVSKIRDEYKDVSNDVILKLGFRGKDSIAMRRAIESLEDGPKKKLLEVITDEEAREILELREKKEKEREKQNKTLGEALSKQNNYRKNENDNENDEEEEGYSSISNKERRASKLEEEFSQSMGDDKYINKKLAYTCKTTNKDERSFLRKEYRGICQICSKEIRGYNNINYFVARNVIKTQDLPEEFKNADFTGWNSLCLCPNCAAEYLYGVKDLTSFSNQVEKIDIEEHSVNPIYIEIFLQGEKKKIKYSPKHFLALKTAFKVFK